ncbi:MAG: alkaline phosphatase family protein [Nitrospirota bacterium]
MFLIISLPIRYLIKKIKIKRYNLSLNVKRIVIIGLDGMDPTLVQRFIKEEKLPNLLKLKRKGVYAPLGTTCPAISPVAWSSFSTGVNPGKHNIFDFLTRDKNTYLPILSSSQIKKPKRDISIGKYSFPLGKPIISLERKSKSFWKILSDYNIHSSIIRVPVTFPPERFNGVQLSAMCVPDLRGTQGTFTFYTTKKETGKYTGGIRIPVNFKDNRIESFIYGPPNPILHEPLDITIPFIVTVDQKKGLASIKISEQVIILKKGEYSGWTKLTFKAGFGIKIHGICKFLITEISPDFGLYVSPINIDPENPVLPISYPFIYAHYLSKVVGSYATLGLAEDTWALNEEILSDSDFIKQCSLIHKEREKMFFNEFEKTRNGVCVCVFDITDRIQHMLWRYMDDEYQDNGNNEEGTYKDAIEDIYKKMDNLVGKVMERIDEESVLMVISDHGFKSFKRCVNLNSWLYLNGYLSLKDGKKEGDEWFKDVDWNHTKAYAMGMSGLYINQKGREANGIISHGNEKETLKKELMLKLSGLRDENKDKIAIKDVMDNYKIYKGPYVENAPDLIIGYNEGYRVSWDSVIGKVNEVIFEDNTKKWSGDHCIHPDMVPGVFFCNKKPILDSLNIVDIAPTVLKLFGIKIPPYIDGRSMF